MIQFSKFHASGNDFIIIKDNFNNLNLKDETIKNMCDRKHGIGADGLIVIKPDVNKIVLRFYNNDASQPEMCINGVRCVGNLLKQIFPHKNTFQLILSKRIVKVTIKRYNPHQKKTLVEISLGTPSYDYYGKKIGSNKAVKINTIHTQITGYYVSFDNPHLVIFTDLNDKEKLEKIAKELQKIFIYGINVEFADVRSSKNINALFWERGVGWTDSCGSGSCAIAVVLKNHRFPGVENFYIKSPGGSVKVKVKKNSETFLEGYSYKVFDGMI